MQRFIPVAFLIAFCSAEITPPANTVVKEPKGVSLGAEFLYWKAEEDGLTYAIGGYDPNGSPIVAKGSTHSPDTRWDPGVRVNMGIDLPHDDWQVYMQYTWIKNKYNEDQAHQLSSTNLLLSSWIYDPDDLIQSLASAGSKWKITTNQFDLELGRHFFLSNWFSFMPAIGLKGAWSNQKNVVRYTENVLSSETITRLEMHEYFRSIGLRAASHMRLRMSKQWSIFANGALSTLWTRFSNWNRYVLASSEGSPLLASWAEKSYIIKPVIELNLGIQFETLFSDKHQALKFHAGWEQQIWLDFNQFSNITSSRNGDLTYQGLILKLEYQF